MCTTYGPFSYLETQRPSTRLIRFSSTCQCVRGDFLSWPCVTLRFDFWYDIWIIMTAVSVPFWGSLHTWNSKTDITPYSANCKCSLAGRQGVFGEIHFRNIDDQVKQRALGDSEDDVVISKLSDSSRLAEKVDTLFDNDELRLDALNHLMSDTDLDSDRETIDSPIVEEPYEHPRRMFPHTDRCAGYLCTPSPDMTEAVRPPSQRERTRLLRNANLFPHCAPFGVDFTSITYAASFRNV